MNPDSACTGCARVVCGARAAGRGLREQRAPGQQARVRTGFGLRSASTSASLTPIS